MKKWEQVISEVWTEHQRLINSSQSPRPPFRINYLGHSVENLQPIRYLQIKFSRRKTRSQQRVSVTAPQTSRFLDCFSCEIGPLQATIHVVQNRHAEEQKSHWDKTNRGNYHLKLCMPFICLVPVRLLLSSMAVLYQVNGQPQKIIGHSCCGVPANVLSLCLFVFNFGEANKKKWPISQEKQSRSLWWRDNDTLLMVMDVTPCHAKFKDNFLPLQFSVLSRSALQWKEALCDHPINVA